MKSTEDIRNFLNAFVDWAAVQGDVHAIALVGSYARGAARDDSDIDLVLLTDQPQKYLEELKWIERFGRLEKRQTEDYGKLTSVRVWYRDGVEVEYGITVSAPPNHTLRLVQFCIQCEYLVKAILGLAWAVAVGMG
jgi:predicted nucleotidyltransferase